MMKTILKIILC